jgi:hypothetical protein
MGQDATPVTLLSCAALAARLTGTDVEALQQPANAMAA